MAKFYLFAEDNYWDFDTEEECHERGRELGCKYSIGRPKNPLDHIDWKKIGEFLEQEIHTECDELTGGEEPSFYISNSDLEAVVDVLKKHFKKRSTSRMFWADQDTEKQYNKLGQL